MKSTEFNDMLVEIKKNYPFEEMVKDLNCVSSFSLTYYDYINTARDYGTGDYLSMMEAHVLSDIVETPGITVTKLAKKWDMTKSAISQTVRKLISKDYIKRVNSKDDAKVFYLYPNDTAIEFNKAHIEFDTQGMYNMKIKLLESFSKEEIKTFHMVANLYTQIVREQLEKEELIKSSR